jgi:hypothetical protein
MAKVRQTRHKEQITEIDSRQNSRFADRNTPEQAQRFYIIVLRMIGYGFENAGHHTGWVPILDRDRILGFYNAIQHFNLRPDGHD